MPETTDEDVHLETHNTFYVHPEYRLPADTTPGDSVASGADVSTHTWTWKGDESLHPCWAIPRMSADDLRRRNAALGEQRSFNVELEEKQYNVVTVGDVQGHSIATTWSVSVPMIRNPGKIAKGEELLLEVACKPAVAGKRKPASWKDDVAAAARAKAKAKAKVKAAADDDEV